MTLGLCLRSWNFSLMFFCGFSRGYWVCWDGLSSRHWGCLRLQVHHGQILDKPLRKTDGCIHIAILKFWGSSRVITVNCLLQNSSTYMVGWPLLSVEGLGDKHLPCHRVNAEHLIGRLVSTHTCDAVSYLDLSVLVGANLCRTERRGWMCYLELRDTCVHTPVGTLLNCTRNFSEVISSS